ncbi:hypothetical protein EII20_00945 [Comamonadaceae bacterium OH2545_COT-014]|nr:hypothetical protein EII20_00945 [Comamonadaceae bacterium OH2545_COT-014]
MPDVWGLWFLWGLSFFYDISMVILKIMKSRERIVWPFCIHHRMRFKTCNPAILVWPDNEAHQPFAWHGSDGIDGGRVVGRWKAIGPCWNDGRGRGRVTLKVGEKTACNEFPFDELQKRNLSEHGFFPGGLSVEREPHDFFFEWVRAENLFHRLLADLDDIQATA